MKPKVKKIRDLSVIDIGTRYLVIAVDSFGGIGPKEHDIVKLSPDRWAVALLRVPLLEVISTGAEPILVIDALSVEYEPTGKIVIDALKRELSRLGFKDIPLNGSTEDNIPVTLSGGGIMIVGDVEKEDFWPGKSKRESNVFVIGVPKSGPDEEVNLWGDPEIPDILDIMKLRNLNGVYDILPVGSHGILYEAEQLAKSASLKLKLKTKTNFLLDLKKSAGPSTCLVFSTILDEAVLKSKIRAPLYKLGILK